MFEGDFATTIYYAVVDEDLRIVYRGTSIEACAMQLKPGKLVGRVFGKGDTQKDADSAAIETMRKLVDKQIRFIEQKAASE